ncbi:4-nitrophenyl phosphatase [Bradyrhizobium erythrophlei]|jgi:4-nitrophenyl phosphatase|uniref:4-nitrophenyl phosphatase n=1 Tax=Bradyrhizobium erythrophlei TaxID=1437360 RepID=A0A1M5Q8R7_9BRAD|nr:4-nitrophenyl phosphatase [Bradyrhizobium erythrophlei]
MIRAHPRKEELFLAQPGGHGVTPIRGVISDLDGVVYRGSQSIPESVKAFQTWQARGVPYAFVTNNATKSAAQFAAKLTAMGVPVSAAQVFNAISATASLMRRRWPPGTRVFAIGENPLLEELEAGGFTSAGENAEVVVLGFDYALTYDKLRTAVRAALNGAAVVVTNPDTLTPADSGFEPCVGVLAAAVTAAVPSAVPIVVGKPQPFMVEEALAHVATANSETIMIGDQIATDIVAGQSAGLRSVLVTTGLPYIAVAGVTPDRVVSSLLELVDDVTK